jgi:hypothetical protein
VYEVSTGVRSTRNKDGMVILDIMRGQVFRLNATGAVIFERLQQRTTESELSQVISDEFLIPLQIAETDIRAFLASLEKQGLVNRKNTEELPCL